MPLQLPNLDDRDYDQLRQEALEVINNDLNTNWDDLTPGDPGIVLLEGFTYLTEQLIYRLNRLPRKLYIAFLRLLGVTLAPPQAAEIEVGFKFAERDEEDLARKPVVVPAGTRLLLTIGEDTRAAPITYRTSVDVELSAHQTMPAPARAFNFDYVGEESIGTGTGRPGQAFAVNQSPIVAPMQTQWDLRVGVELSRRELDAVSEQLESTDNQSTVIVELEPGVRDALYKAEDGKLFRVWKHVENFANLTSEEQFVYTVDRTDGVIQFAPATVTEESKPAASSNGAQQRQQLRLRANVPAKGAEIRAWYPHGGGEKGNVRSATAEQRDLLKFDFHEQDEATHRHLIDIDIVFNAQIQPGVAAESLENALVRGPLELFTFNRAVTALDFETLVLKEARGLIARAKAYTQFYRWRHATRGKVELVLVPALKQLTQSSDGADENSQLLGRLKANQTTDLIQRVRMKLQERMPLGIRVDPIWTRYKRITIDASITLLPGADRVEVAQSTRQALHDMISPLPTVVAPQDSNGDSGSTIGFTGGKQDGWQFGNGIQVKRIYETLLNESDVVAVNAVSIAVDDAPTSDVHAISPDLFQEDTWHVASGERLFRSTNNGAGWELIGRMAEKNDEIIRQNFDLVETCAYRPGIVAATSATQSAADYTWSSELFITTDCWESGLPIGKGFDFKIEDMAWLRRTKSLFLLLATDAGLYELKVLDHDKHELEPHTPILVPIMADEANHPLHSVVVIEGNLSNSRVAVSLKSRAGVYLSQNSSLSSSVNTRFLSEQQRQLNQILNELETTRAQADIAARLRAQINAGQLETQAWRRIDQLDQAFDIRTLAVQRLEDNILLWGATMAPADKGHGCLRWRFSEGGTLTSTAQLIHDRWRGGSCLDITSIGPQLFAATAFGGVLTLDDGVNGTQWRTLRHDKLPHLPIPLPTEHEPLRNRDRRSVTFMPLHAIASNVAHLDHRATESGERKLMVGGPQGLFTSNDQGGDYQQSAFGIFHEPQDEVTLPYNWLFISGQHRITIQSSDEANDDRASS